MLFDSGVYIKDQAETLLLIQLSSNRERNFHERHEGTTIEIQGKDNLVSVSQIGEKFDL